MHYINDKDLKNRSYINKDFPAIWQELLELIPKLTKKWDPAKANESDPLAVLIKLLAIYSDKLNYNIDKSILEAFPASLTQLKSAYNIYDTLGYNPQYIRSATLPVVFTYVKSIYAEGGLDETNYAVIPKLTTVCDADNSIYYTTLVDCTISSKEAPGELYAVGQYTEIPAIQGTVRDYEVNGVSTITLEALDSDNKLYFTEGNIAQNGVFVSSSPNFLPDSINNTLLGDWHRVDNIYQVDAQEKAFKFGIDPVSGSCYIQFPAFIANLIGDGLHVKYTLSSGADGNIINNTLTQFAAQETSFTILNSSGEDITEEVDKFLVSDYVMVNNAIATTNGKDVETIDEMYENYQKVKNVFDTLVTLLDYEKYIYRYTDALNNHKVSNIRVSDRTNDLYESYDVVTLSPLEGPKKVHKVTTRTMLPAGDVPKVNAYNIRFYPTESVSSVNTNALFRQSFKTFETSAEAEKWKETLDDITYETKTINHDQLTPGKIIPVKYDLEGEIYLTEKTTNEIANQIMDKIRQSLREKLNARNVTFGRPVSYKDILTVIENSDPRIDYVALQPIRYISKVDLSGSNINDIDNTVTELNDDLAIERNIKAGTLPWTSFNTTFKYNVNQITDTLVSIEPDPEDPKEITVLPFIAIKDTSDFKELTLLSNEYISFTAPAYKESIVYSNYLFFKYIGSEDIIFKEDELVKLPSESKIQFFETRESYNSGNPLYEIPGGSIVKFSFEFDASSSTINSLNQGRIISKMEKQEGAVALNSQIQFFTNATKLLERIKEYRPGASPSNLDYTLGVSEYFMFRVKDSIGFTILGEGTTITFKPGAIFSFLGDEYDAYIKTLQSITIDWYGLINGEASPSNQLSTLWLPNLQYTTADKVSGNDVVYRVNDIITFGEGVKFRQKDKGSVPPADDYPVCQWGWWEDPQSPYTFYTSSPIKIFPANAASTPPVTYVLEYQLPGDSNWQELPKLPDEAFWQGIIRLDLNIAQAQTLLQGGANHAQYLSIEVAGEDKKLLPATQTAIDPAAYSYGVESTLDIATYGSAVTIPGDIAFEARGYKVDLDNYPLTNVSAAGFTEIPVSGSTACWVNQFAPNSAVPGSSDYVCVLPVAAGAEDVHINGVSSTQTTIASASLGYVVLGYGGSVESNASFSLGEPKLVNKSNEYGINLYNSNNSDCIGNIANTVIDNSGWDDFDFTHIPSNESSIDQTNPLSGESYLNKNNVFNRYCLPELSSLKIGEKITESGDPKKLLFANLKISSLSIK